MYYPQCRGLSTKKRQESSGARCYDGGQDTLGGFARALESPDRLCSKLQKNLGKVGRMARIRLTFLEADGRLPKVCMVCGRTAVVVRPQALAWRPWWALFAAPFTVSPVAVLRKAVLQAPLCEAHRSCWESRRWAGLIGFMLLALAALNLAILSLPDAVLIGLRAVWTLVLILWLGWTLFLALTALRAVEITDSHLILSGVAPEFIQAKDDCDCGPNKLRQPLATGFGPAHWSHRPPDQQRECDARIQDLSRPAASPDDSIPKTT